MENKNTFNKVLLVVLFCILILTPNIAYKFVKEENKKNVENRTLSEKPELNIDTYNEYPSLYEEYYNDNLPFKSALVRLNSLIKFKYFDKSPADYVIKGENGWLFYDSKYKNDHDTIADYQGTNKYTKEELEEIAESLKAKKEFLDEKGIEFRVFIAPNKSQIYYEYMPSYIYKNEGKSKADELVEYLRENTDINVVYPKDELLYYKDNFEYDLYDKTDSHWNNIGAYIGYVELMKSMDPDFEHLEVEELKLTAEAFTEGDLAAMINLKGELRDVYFTVHNFKTDIKVELTEDKGNALKRYKSTNENGKKILAYRDSFAVRLIPYLYKDYEESVFVWGAAFSEEQIEQEKPDVVVLEVVERLTDNLKR